MTSLEVKEIRDHLGLSQPEFADRFGLSLATLRHWEQGRRTPDTAAEILLTVIASAPEIVERAQITRR
jgi:putative transcriptional regulator